MKMKFLLDCFRGAGVPPKRKGPRKPRVKGRRKNRHSNSLRERDNQAASRVGSVTPVSPISAASEELEWHDARDFFSTEESGGLSPVSSTGGQNHSQEVQRMVDPYDYDSASEGSDGEAPGSPSLMDRLSGCLTMVKGIHITGDRRLSFEQMSPSQLVHTRHLKPVAGTSIRCLETGSFTAKACEAWGHVSGSEFQVRGVDYLRTKTKVPSEEPIYHLVGVDMFSFDQKQFKVADVVALPRAPPAVHIPAPPEDPTGGCELPGLLIVNVQLPTYPAPFWGPNDGPGYSIVYYYMLPPNFDLSNIKNMAALRLLQRFLNNGRESDGSPTRERLKLIARVENVDEWEKKGPLSSSEFSLLSKYNAKPIMTKPQHYFFTGPNYLEIDLDVHCYAYLARRALGSFQNRLKDVVFDLGLVIQGNSVEELPEQVLAAGRIYRADFTKDRPFSAFLGNQPQEMTPIPNGEVVRMHAKSPPVYPEEDQSLHPELIRLGSEGSKAGEQPPKQVILEEPGKVVSNGHRALSSRGPQIEVSAGGNSPVNGIDKTAASGESRSQG